MLYKVCAKIDLEIESDLLDDDLINFIKSHFKNLPATSSLDIELKKEKIQRIQLGEFSLDDLMPYLDRGGTKRAYECQGSIYEVRMNSQRYFLFRECSNCIVCGLKGTKLFLEYHQADQTPHFNLYGVKKNELILMTKDHIRAKSLGGQDKHSNYQTMCQICNTLKGNSNLTLEDLKTLRNYYEENKDKISKKEMHVSLENLKKKLRKPWDKKKKRSKPEKDVLITICDINLYEDENKEIYGKAVCDKRVPTHRHIGCIKSGVYLEPLVIIKNIVMCKISEEEVVTVNKNLLSVESLGVNDAVSSIRPN